MNERFTKASWPGWETVREIGKGSFGAVYEIQKDVFGKVDKAALKVITIPKDKSDIEEMYTDGYDEKSITDRYKNFLEEIVREYQLMAELKGNRNVVYCDDLNYVNHSDGFGWDIYIKMELLTPLIKVIKTPVDEEQVIRLGMDMCNALISCQKKNIIHRDIKPQNIFMSEEGDYKLGDFGIAKTAENVSTGTKTGTFKYMAPEVYNNQAYGAACDIYSLGLVLYWMLNERRIPFLPLPPAVPTAEEDNKALLNRMSGMQIPAPIHGSEALKKIVLKACEYDQNRRYQSASEMYAELASLNNIDKGSAYTFSEESYEEEEDDGGTWGVFGNGGKRPNPQPEPEPQPKQEPKSDKEKFAENLGDIFAEQAKKLDIHMNLCVPSNKIALGCALECIVPETGERVNVNIPAGKSYGSTITIAGKGKQNPATGKRGNLILTLKKFAYKSEAHKTGNWSGMPSEDLWAYITGCDAPASGGNFGKICGVAFFTILFFVGVATLMIPIACVGFYMAIWLGFKSTPAKKNMIAAKQEWNKRYPKAKC